MAASDKYVRETVHEELRYSPRLRDGIGVCSFDILLEPEAVVVHEWRSGFGNRRVGPRLVFRSGQLLEGADEAFLTPISPDEWVHIEVECGLGSQARVPAIYRVVVTCRGQEPEPYEDLLCVYRRFRTLNQSLFLSSPDEEGSHSLDNIHITLK